MCVRASFLLSSTFTDGFPSLARSLPLFIRSTTCNTSSDTHNTVFIQSSPSFPSNDPTYDPLRDSFGLVDKSPSRWKRFRRAIERMNEENDECTSVKVLWVARHGQVRFVPLLFLPLLPPSQSAHAKLSKQGYHNVAESKYGRPEWDRYWSKLNGDGEMTVRSPPIFSLRLFSASVILTDSRPLSSSGVPTLSSLLWVSSKRKRSTGHGENSGKRAFLSLKSSTRVR
jgi:hypothetical protein